MKLLAQWLVASLLMTGMPAADAPVPGARPVMRIRSIANKVPSGSGATFGDTTKVYINGQRVMRTYRYVEGEILLARSYDVHLLKLTIRDKSDESPASPGSGEKKAATVRTEVLPPIPVTQYEKMVQEIESIAAMGLAPLAWNADRTLAPENAAQVGKALKIWADMEDLRAIQSFWGPQNLGYGEIPRVGLDLGLGDNGNSGKYWIPTLPSNASKDRLKVSISKVRDLLKTLQKQTVPAAERTRLWKSLPAEVAPVLALFRQYCAPTHIWMFPFNTKKMLFEKSIQLGDGTTVFYTGTFHP